MAQAFGESIAIVVDPESSVIQQFITEFPGFAMQMPLSNQSSINKYMVSVGSALGAGQAS